MIFYRLFLNYSWSTRSCYFAASTVYHKIKFLPEIQGSYYPYDYSDMQVMEKLMVDFLVIPMLEIQKS
jgi:hypothetical protein